MDQFVLVVHQRGTPTRTELSDVRRANGQCGAVDEAERFS